MTVRSWLRHWLCPIGFYHGFFYPPETIDPDEPPATWIIVCYTLASCLPVPVIKVLDMIANRVLLACARRQFLSKKSPTDWQKGGE